MKIKKDISIIPKGIYCIDYNKRHGLCPYWQTIKTLPEQENGYCAYLGKSDFEINEENGPTEWKSGDGKRKGTVGPHEIPVSLIWDQCKDPDCPRYPTDKELDEEFKGDIND
jgi:hypothetical protein